MREFHKLAFGLAACILVQSSGLLAQTQENDQHTTRATRNVILVFADGIRWQDVYRGPDIDILKAQTGDKAPVMIKDYDGLTTDAAREKLMPFFWGHIAKEGILFGNRDKGSQARVTNNMWFSYPGYSETITGFADDVNITSNRGIPNPNVSVFEWLNQQPELKDKVAAFGHWDVLSAIFNTGRCGFPVDNGEHPFKPAAGTTPIMDAINELRAVSTEPAGGYDILTYGMFSEYLRARKPRVVYLNLSETDNWAHGDNYVQYLKCLTRLDGWLKSMQEMLDSMPEYKNNTTIILTVDHGRGDKDASIQSWNYHDRKTTGSDNIWIAVWGPDTPAVGEVTSGEVTQSQIAATLAAALGYDYNSAQPRAGLPIREAISGR